MKPRLNTLVSLLVALTVALLAGLPASVAKGVAGVRSVEAPRHSSEAAANSVHVTRDSGLSASGLDYPKGLAIAPLSLPDGDAVVQVTTGDTTDREAALVTTSNGDLVTVWQRNWELYTARSTDSGATWSDAAQLAGCCRTHPAMLRTSDDALWVAYSMSSDLWYRTSDDGGLTWSDESQLTAHPSSDRNPKLAKTADGRIWVTWLSERGSGSDLWYKTTSDQGETWTPDTELPFEPGWNTRPSLAQAPNGTLWMVWFRDYKVAYSTSTNGGSTWAELDYFDAGGPAVGPIIRRASDDTLWLVYQLTRYEGGRWRSHLHYRTSDDSGETWSGAQQFTSFVGDNEWPDTAPMPDGQIGLVWHSDRTSVPKIWFGIPGVRMDIDPPPYVSTVEQNPSPNPASDDIVTVRAHVHDEGTITAVHLVWTADGVLQSDTPMFDDGVHDDYGPGDDWYGVQIGPFPVGTEITYQVRAEDNDGNVVVSPISPISFTALEPFSRTADILFVPDQRGNDTHWFQPYFTDALEVLRYDYDVWDTGLRGPPGGEVVNLYTDGAVIWAAPTDGYYHRSEVRSTIKGYLASGGSLFITGQDVGRHTNHTAFLSDYLHATYVQDNTGIRSLAGTAGDPIGDGLSISISGGDGASNQWSPDEIDPVGPAVTVFTYETGTAAALVQADEREHPEPAQPTPGPTVTPTPSPDTVPHSEAPTQEGADFHPANAAQNGISSGTAGLRVDTGTYRVVYLAFGFEAINSAPDRAAVMERTLAWLQDRLPRPVQLSPADGASVVTGNTTFTWAGVVGASGYQVQIDTSSGFASPDLISETMTGTGYSASLGLGSWYWRVRTLPDGAWTAAWQFTVAEPVVQVSTDAGADYRPAVVQAADETLWVAWYSWRSGNADIWFKTSVDGGGSWSEASQLTTHTSGDYNPAIMETADGTLWVAWYSDRSGNRDIWYKTSTDNGENWSSAVQLTTNAADDYDPTLLEAADGTLWVAWYSYRSDNADIWYKTSADKGNTWSPAAQLTTATARDVSPAIAQAADGQVWVVWARDGLLWSRAFSSDIWLPEAPLTTDGTWSYGPSIARANDGTLWLMWYRYINYGSQLWHKTSSDHGATWSKESSWTRFAGYDSHPNLAALNDGSVGLAWTSDRAVKTDIWFGVFGHLEDVNPPPYVSTVEQNPSPNPASDDIVTVRAHVHDEGTITAVHLVWTADGVLQSDTPMFDDGAHDDYGPGDDWYGVHIGPFPVGTEITYQVRAEDNDGNVVASPISPISFTALEPFSRTADILFVPDQGGNDTHWFQPYFTDALALLGYEYDIWDTGLRGPPGGEVVNLYTDGAVIWATPTWGYFRDWDVRSTLRSYLDAGGKLFITGQDVAYYTSGTAFLNDYLHAFYVQDNSGIHSLAGTAEDPIGDGLSISISGGDGASNQWSPDEIDPVGPAVTVFTYETGTAAALVQAEDREHPEPAQATPGPIVTPTPSPDMVPHSEAPTQEGADFHPANAAQNGISSGTAGLRVDTGTYRVVYLAFGFEAINSAPDRAAVMERTLAWLQDRLPRPVQLSPADGDSVVTGNVTFTWAGVVGADGYEIQVDSTDIFASPDLISDAVTSTSHTIHLKLGSWYWRVRTLPDGAWTTTRQLNVEADVENPVAVTIDPQAVTLTAGQCQLFTLTAEDGYGNTFDVTDADRTTFSADGGGNMDTNEFCAETEGEWTVTGTYLHESDGATVTVEPDVENPDSVSIEPQTEMVTAGESVAYTLTAADSFSNTWDVTDQTEFNIDDYAGGEFDAGVYRSEVAGEWTVTGSWESLEDTAELTVEPAAAADVSLTPEDVTLVEGQCQAFELIAHDAFDNVWDVTDVSTFAVDGGGTLTHNEFCVDTVGMWTVTGTFLALSADAKVEVMCRPPEIVALTASSPVTLGRPMQFTATVEATEPITHTWDFGDEGAGALLAGGEETATYLFAEPGTYTVTLTVENAGGSDTAGIVAVVQHLIYLPLGLRDYVSYFEGPWEVDPNNTWAQANGPLISGRDYYGHPDDERDYFSIYTRRAGRITVSLTGHTGQGVQLQLFHGAPRPDGSNRVRLVHQEPYEIVHHGPAGWYYILIYTESGHNEHIPYTLRVTYPD